MLRRKSPVWRSYCTEWRLRATSATSTCSSTSMLFAQSLMKTERTIGSGISEMDCTISVTSAARFSGSSPCVGHQQACLETNEILFVPLDVGPDLLCRMRTAERIRVFAVGQQHHPHVQPLAQYHVDTAERRLDTCRIAVVNDGNVLRETADENFIWSAVREVPDEATTFSMPV